MLPRASEVRIVYHRSGRYQVKFIYLPHAGSRAGMNLSESVMRRIAVAVKEYSVDLFRHAVFVMIFAEIAESRTDLFGFEKNDINVVYTVYGGVYHFLDKHFAVACFRQSCHAQFGGKRYLFSIFAEAFFPGSQMAGKFFCFVKSQRVNVVNIKLQPRSGADSIVRKGLQNS